MANHKSIWLSALGAAAVATAVAVGALAAVPVTVAIEGRLLAKGGAPVVDGYYQLTFQLYADKAAKAPSWTETVKVVSVKAGRFQHTLGTVNALTVAHLDAKKSSWLSVAVAGDPELPRSPLSAVAYARRAEVADGLECSGCVEAKALAKGAVGADAVSFKWAAADKPGGVALAAKTADTAGQAAVASQALDLKCTGCVSVAEVKFDADVDLGGNALKAKKIAATDLVAQTVVVGSIAGDGSKLTGVKITGGACKPSEVVTGVLADGSLTCADGGGGALAKLLNNEYTAVYKPTKLPVAIPDNDPIGLSVEIVVPDVGLAKSLTVHVELTSSDISGLTVQLFDPSNKQHVLYDKGGQGKALKAAYPSPDKPASGDLGAWLGKNPKGKWRLKVIDLKKGPGGKDGAIVNFGIQVDVLSSKQLFAKGTLTLLKAKAPPHQCTINDAGAMYFDTKTVGLRYCDGSLWSVVGLSCGNGVINVGEECDDGNQATSDGCLPVCVKASTKCGNNCKIAGSVPGAAQVTKLIPGDGAAHDYFGRGVGLSGDRLVVGARGDDDKGSGSGSVYVYARQIDGTWKQEHKLVAADGAPGDGFGSSVAIDGNLVVVGSPFDDDKGTTSGSVYIYARQNDGGWKEQAKLVASDGAASDDFGLTVAISDNWVLVGSPFDDDKGTTSGSAYVFTRNADGTWKQEAKLVAKDGAKDDNFGYSVAISGKRLIVGAYGDDDKGSRSGSAYVYSRQGNASWQQEAKLVADDGAIDNYFGMSVSISGVRLVVASYGDDQKDSDAGSVYVYERQNDGIWKRKAKLVANDGAASDYFGQSVDISGDRLVVGAHGDDEKGSVSGSAYVFSRHSDGAWKPEAKIIDNDGAANDYFGFLVVLSGKDLLVGAPNDNGFGKDSGSAHVFSVGKPLCSAQGMCICKAGYGGLDCAQELN